MSEMRLKSRGGQEISTEFLQKLFLYSKAKKSRSFSSRPLKLSSSNLKFSKVFSVFFLLYFLRSRIFVLGRNYPLMYLYIFIAVMPKYLVTPQLSSKLIKAAFFPVNQPYYAVDVYWKLSIVSEFGSYFCERFGSVMRAKHHAWKLFLFSI